MTDENKYPQGKLNEHDEGELAIRVGIKNKKVVIDFGKEIVWFGMDADMAANLGALLIKRAREIGLTKPFEIEL